MSAEKVEGKGHIIGDEHSVEFDNELAHLPTNELEKELKDIKQAALESRRDVTMNRALIYNSNHELVLAGQSSDK